MKTIVQTPTNGLENSLDFYKRLNFKLLNPSNPVLLTDGKFFLEINPVRFARPGIKMYQDSWAKELEQLKSITDIHPIDNGFLLGDPSGVSIYLLEKSSPISEDFKKELKEESFGLTGNFSGISLESLDMKRSEVFWNILGFEKTMGSVEQGWISLQDSSGMDISLMKPLSCPHLFFNPSLTFFNGKNNVNLIKSIRQNNVPIAEEITHFNKEGIADNIVLRDPGGLGMFIFSD